VKGGRSDARCAMRDVHTGLASVCRSRIAHRASRMLLLAACLVAAPRPTPAFAQTRLVIVSGLSGEPRFAEQFTTWARAMADAARGRMGVADSMVTWLAEDPARAPGRIGGKATRDAVAATLASLAARMGPRERLMLLLVGHGTPGDPPRLALPGPDLAAPDLARMLAPFGTRDVAVVLAASASGDFAPVLAGPHRVVASATKSGLEANETRFGQYFVDAYTKDGADADKDGRVSLQEAFAYATAEVKREYDDGGKLLTEHARLVDAGGLARAFVLEGARTAASTSPALAALETKKQDVERRIEALRARKAQMEAKAYDDALETLMVELAGVSREIRQQAGRP